MDEQDKKVNKPMFWVGLGLILIAAGALLLVKRNLGIWPILTGFFGIISIGASRYRPLK